MNLKKLENFELKIPFPILGIGCGVLGLSLAKVSVKMGKYASQLLRALEYRGYDSTGAAFQKDDLDVKLLKDVGAPSTLVKTLGIEDEEGKIFCGQVRWATFGNVTQKNAQPHKVKCKQFIYGAHNGNITNTRELKTFLLSEGHNVVSDNDGEMLVHTVEHYFDNELSKIRIEDQTDHKIRKECMRKGIIQAADKMVGSYAAVVVDPLTETSWAIKGGSSLYFGVGEIDDNQFGLASSDLTAVLRFTKMLVNLREGEFVEFQVNEFKIFAFKEIKVKKPGKKDQIINAGDQIKKQPVRSKLRAEDTELLPPFDYFMEQEIHAEVESSGKLVKLFQGGSNTAKHMLNLLQKENIYKTLEELYKKISKEDEHEMQQKIFDDFRNSDEAENFYKKVKAKYPAIYNELVKKDFEKKYFFSSDKNLYIDLLGKDFDKISLLISKALDTLNEFQDVDEFNKSVDDFLEIAHNTCKNNRNIYTIACGTSYHATLVAALFFNEIANLEIIPILPGNFRGQYSRSLHDNDVIIGVSQSGETKDLIDIFNDVEKSGLNIKKVVLVNNMNSTLGQEKSDVSIPIFCGPEIAVPATKSFINQITLFYYLAIKTAEKHLEIIKEIDPKNHKKLQHSIAERKESIKLIPKLIQETIETTEDQIEFVASKIYMEPSMHILATKIMGVAKEGALKIRETVLNHTEGGEASEFKHGPNTILGKNTVFGLKSVKAMIRHFNNTLDEMDLIAEKRGLKSDDRRKISRALSNYVFTQSYPFNLSPKAMKVFKETAEKFDFFQNAYRNYPLIYVTGPDERDVNLTISQINTHKIRGGDTFVIAEEDDKLFENAKTNPHDEGYYGWGYIILPKTGDTLLTTFSATIVLQILALKMSVRKMAYLDRMEISDHGVHPDVPKNVSKSITVD
ncbi:MAG: SIS domain-containing protein [Candidatus Cloacimonetes bacterium]|nr:SIS domain-containing protein [Candidatus Cloacimonadota bacterium]MCF7813899.1 SIS domain-containing protein [Candidatus Cloacimonadota bacterium]MCF7868890.1 SIS domain-containing protein [Candidatus Cloacimonadota bacterium]MCF7884011.1 SIS domain-containing protein [Candidatus Cloacimonadota bacterium]